MQLKLSAGRVIGMDLVGCVIKAWNYFKLLYSELKVCFKLLVGWCLLIPLLFGLGILFKGLLLLANWVLISLCYVRKAIRLCAFKCGDLIDIVACWVHDLPYPNEEEEPAEQFEAFAQELLASDDEPSEDTL